MILIEINREDIIAVMTSGYCKCIITSIEGQRMDFNSISLQPIIFKSKCNIPHFKWRFKACVKNPGCFGKLFKNRGNFKFSFEVSRLYYYEAKISVPLTLC